MEALVLAAMDVGPAALARHAAHDDDAPAAVADRGRQAPAGTGAASRSMRMAVALNLAVPDLGSVASIVSRFVATSS